MLNKVSAVVCVELWRNINDTMDDKIFQVKEKAVSSIF